MFTLCFSYPQVRYDLWRRVLKTFWALVVGYSMVVLIAIYMYQFRSVSALFRQIMGMSEEGYVSFFFFVKLFVWNLYKSDLSKPYITLWFLSCLSSLPQTAWLGFGKVQHSGAVCTYSASCCFPIGLYPPAALLQLWLPRSDGPGQRTCSGDIQVKQNWTVQMF